MLAWGCGGEDPGLGSASAGDPSTSSTGTDPSDSSTSTTDPDTSTTEAADSGSSTGPGLPPVDCSDYVGQVSPEQVAMSPRDDEEAEVLAIEASGEAMAPPALYERVVADLAIIRKDAAELADVLASPSWNLSELLVSLDDAATVAVERGTYQGWDCPNALYGVTEVEPWGLDGTYHVRFDARVNPLMVEADYLVLDGVLAVEPGLGDGDGNDVCMSSSGDVFTYIFDRGRGDCPAGCTEHLYTGFTVDARGSLVMLGTYEITDGGDPVPPPPEWFTDAADCTQWL